MARRKKQKLDLDQEQVPISQQIKRFFDIDCFVEFMLPQEMVEEVYAKRREPRPMEKYRNISKNLFPHREPKKGLPGAACNCIKSRRGQPRCTDNSCMNRSMFMECPANQCPTGDQCRNQRFQKKEKVEGVEVKWTEGRGYGLFTKVDIEPETLIMEYCGEVISQEECIERLNTVYQDWKNYYFLSYSNGEVIDAGQKGNECRFANHSCDPNCYIEKWTVNGEDLVGLFAKGRIVAGTELTYNYKFESNGARQKCLCGATNCRGFLGVRKRSKEEIDEMIEEAEKMRKRNLVRAASLEWIDRNRQLQCKYLQAEKLLASKKLGDTYGVWVKQFKRRKAPVARRKASRTRRSFGGDVNKTQVPRKKAKKHTGETKGKRGRSRKKDIEDSDENDENKENIAPPRRLMA